MRKSIVAANWKMNGDANLVEAFAKSGLKPNDKVQVIFGLPAIFLREASKAGISDLAAEDVSSHDKGAYTGETSAAMLQEAGVKYCIIGHSERRTYHGEDEKILADKWLQLKAKGIIPIYCIGETEQEYDAGTTQQAIERQLFPMLDKALIDADTVIAYEPVWAIGTGKAATPEYAQEVHLAIRKILKEKVPVFADKVRVLYGGSVKPENAGELIAKEDIDGFLVGGASLKVESFSQIVEAIS